MPLVFILIFFVSLPFSAVSEPWEVLAPDLAVNSQSVSPIEAFDTSLLFVRTKLEKFELKIVRAQDYGKKTLPVAELVKRSGAIAGINAHFFDENTKPLGLLVRDSKIENHKHNGGKTLSGVFAQIGSSFQILSRLDDRISHATLAVQAGPRLLIAGRVAEGIDVSSALARRSGVCIDNKRRLILFSTRKAYAGISLSDLAGYLKTDPINCYDALNFDGGSSSQIYMKYSNKLIFNEIGEDVPVALVILPILSGS